MNIWKDVLITAIIASVVALLFGILLIKYLEHTQQDYCNYTPLSEIKKGECTYE